MPRGKCGYCGKDLIDHDGKGLWRPFCVAQMANNLMAIATGKERADIFDSWGGQQALRPDASQLQLFSA